MAPSATFTETIALPVSHSNGPLKLVSQPAPLKQSGILSSYPQGHLTPLLGTVFKDIDLSKILRAGGRECDDVIRDLAIAISERGVGVFPGQKDLSVADQKLLCTKLGQLTTRPYTSGLNIHPLNQTPLEDGTIDAELTTLA